MMNRLLLALVVVGAVCAGTADAQTGPELGKTLGGEACRAGSDPVQGRPVEIFCAGNGQSVGQLQVGMREAPFATDAVARRADILAQGRALMATLTLSEQLSCDAGQFAGDSDVLLYLCTMHSTSWPRLMLISGGGHTVVQAEGTPGMLPVLTSAIAAALGQPVSPGDAGQRLLAGWVPETVLKASTADFARYAQSVEAARIYSSRSDFAAAEAALRGALEINAKLFGPDGAPVGLAVMELAVQVSNQGRFDEAADLFRRASPIIEATQSADARARLNSYLALDAANRRDFAKALTFARQATAERRAQLKAANTINDNGAGLSDLPTMSSGELAHSLRIEAEMALRLDDLPDAQAAAEEALWIINLEPGLALWWRADVLSLMGEVNERRGRITAAEQNYLEAINVRQKLFGESAPLVLSHLIVGRFYTDQQLYPKALEHFRIAMAILQRSPIARARIVPDQLVPYLAAATSMTAGPGQRALLDAEIFRAIQLVNSGVADQAIARASVRLAAANPALASLVRDVQQAESDSDRYRIEIAAEQAKSDDERSAERQALLARNLVLTSARAGELAARVQKEFPDYARLTNSDPVELAGTQAQLAPRQALLSFVVGYKGSYGLLATRNGLVARRLDATVSSLTADIALLRRAFKPQLGTLPDFPLGNAHTLYTQLLAPFADDLKTVDHLFVAPGPVLANLPFGLLVTQAPSDRQSYGDVAWLIRSVAISQVPSPRAFVLLRQAERTRVAAPRSFLGLGNPLLTGMRADGASAAALETLALNCREASAMPAALLNALPPLPDTAAEVNSVARALGADTDSVLLGRAANESALRARALDQYRVLYFATHGLLPGELHCQAEPGLVLSPPQAAATTADSDGLLEASEVAGLKLNADLVTLSACNTAAAGGGRFGGDALEGLADAFFNAGARAVLASHWEVPSAETAKLMTDLFQRYGKDRQRGLAQALRQSQLDMTEVQATAHPYYWAAFTLIGVGEGETIQTVQQANGDRL